MKQFSNTLKNYRSKDQTGINMVDLMMWIVIASLLLAAAIQGIGYYQQNALIYQMKNDVSHAAEVVSAKAALNGGQYNATAVSEGTTDATKTAGITVVPDAGANDADGYVLRSSAPAVLDKDVVYLSKQRGGYSPGVHIVPKGTVIAPDGVTSIDPGAGTGGGGTGGTGSKPTTDTSSIMTTVWDTRITWPNDTPATCSTITVPLTENVNVTIDWGDGTPLETVTAPLPSHTYADTPGLKTVKINGTFTGWVGQNWDSWSDLCLTKVTSWGDGTNTSDITGGFNYATALTDVARLPKTVTNQSDFLFAYATAFTGESVSKWDVSHVTRMNSWFDSATAFTGDVSKWDTSNVTNMQALFADSTFNGDLSQWKTQNVTNTNFMFANNTAFSGDLSKWDVTSVEDMGAMFQSTTFNGDISGWKTYRLRTVQGMFSGDHAFNANIGGWDTSHMTTINSAFGNATSFNQDISGWDVSHVTDMQHVFAGATSFNQDVSRWDVSSATTMYGMFANATAFNQNLSGWNVANVADHPGFGDGSGLTPENFPNFPTP